MFLKEAFDLPVGFITRDGVTLLNQASQFLHVPFKLQKLVFSQLAPHDLGSAKVLVRCLA